MITEKDIQLYFQSLENDVTDPGKRFPLHQYRQHISRDDGAGIYCLYNKGVLCYVGETGNLFERMRDITRTLNHTFRRSLGANLFRDHENYWPATSFKKFHDDIEKQLDEYVLANILVALKPVPIGRKEFEEWMQAKYSDIEWLNKEKKRKAY